MFFEKVKEASKGLVNDQRVGDGFAESVPVLFGFPAENDAGDLFADYSPLSWVRHSSEASELPLLLMAGAHKPDSGNIGEDQCG